MNGFVYNGSSSFWDVLPTITGQFFDSRRAEPSRVQPTVTPPPGGPPVSRELQQLLPFLLLAVLIGVGAVAYRALR